VTRAIGCARRRPICQRLFGRHAPAIAGFSDAGFDRSTGTWCCGADLDSGQNCGQRGLLVDFARRSITALSHPVV
jgi:hypothetical protein